MKKFIKEFREFINRGNVMDMAVGIIIGGAFTSIVSSLVDDIINPILGLFGGMNFDQLKWNILGEVTLNYGKFISAVLNFLIMALVIFTLMRVMNSAAEKLNHNKEKNRLHRQRRNVLIVRQRLPLMQPDVRIVLRFWKKSKRRNKTIHINPRRIFLAEDQIIFREFLYYTGMDIRVTSWLSCATAI